MAEHHEETGGEEGQRRAVVGIAVVTDQGARDRERARVGRQSDDGRQADRGARIDIGTDVEVAVADSDREAVAVLVDVAE